MTALQPQKSSSQRSLTDLSTPRKGSARGESSEGSLVTSVPTHGNMQELTAASDALLGVTQNVAASHSQVLHRGS